MAAKNVTFENLRTQIKNGNYAPIYLLHGEEGYFIDMLVKDFESILSDDEKEFNQYTLFAPQVEAPEIADVCRRYPMMADRQVVIVKEAQAARADMLDKLVPYIKQPNLDTVLVICSRGANAKGRSFLDAVKKSDNCVIFTSSKVPEWKLADHIKGYINGRGLNVAPAALEMLKEYIGSDLSRMYNEVDKLMTILGAGAMVTPEAVERHIGVSKDYNSFELVDAVANRDSKRATRITAYFRANPKAAPSVMVCAALFNFFSDLLVTYFVKDKSERGLMQALGLKSAFPLKRINAARSKYNAFQVIEIIRAIRAFDAQSKGIGSRRSPDDLLDELVFRILTVPGNLFPDC